MNSARHSSRLAIRVALLLLVLSVPAQAYIDPGTGALIWQVVGAFFLGTMYQIRKLFIRFRKGK